MTGDGRDGPAWETLLLGAELVCSADGMFFLLNVVAVPFVRASPFALAVFLLGLFGLGILRSSPSFGGCLDVERPSAARRSQRPPQMAQQHFHSSKQRRCLEESVARRMVEKAALTALRAPFT